MTPDLVAWADLKDKILKERDTALKSLTRSGLDIAATENLRGKIAGLDHVISIVEPKKRQMRESADEDQ